jgi:plasmid stabilization system protein ParE
MKIIWSDFASETLREIYDYYKEVAGEPIAKKIKENIFLTTRQLINHPESGQIEETLLQLEEGHRYLVNKNYKIVYKRVKEGVLITDVFDTRQDPIKINNPKRKTIRKTPAFY